MQQLSFILICLTVILNLTYADDKWIWSKTRNQNGLYPATNKRIYYTDEREYARAERDREPTTKKPLLGQEQNDDIDDYTDSNDEPIKQNSPYLPNGGNPAYGGQFNGFNNYPQIGGGGGFAGNGVLVGPGGPTGIIGRPHSQYPAGLGPTAFPGGQGGYPDYTGSSFNPQTFGGAAVNSNPGFPGYNGLNNVLGQYPGQQPIYPNTQQFAGAQYPQAQYPQAQYPGVQYPTNPQFTEGYGLANLNHGFNYNPQSNFNAYPNYGTGYDEYPAQVEGKSSSVKSINKKVDDKVAKSLKKV